MRVLFVSASYSNYFAIDPVVRELFRRGHQVHLIVGMRKKPNLPDDALQNALADLPNLVVHPISVRRFLRGAVRNLREVLNYAHVLNNEGVRQWDVALWRRFFPPWMWHVVNMPMVKAKLRDHAFQHTLRALEKKIPVDAAIRKEIRQINPDVVLLLPLVNPDSLETEYFRAAQVLGIPTVYTMVSWDNISSKGTFHGLPDYGIVWNEPLANELAHLHNFPRERIYLTGAPRFSHLVNGVDKEHVLSREALCQQTVLDIDKPYILYVCSTFLVNAEKKKEGDESILILEAARALEMDPRTKDINILVRPHPLNSHFIPKLLSKGQRNIFVFPVNGEIPDTEEKMKRYYSSIYHAAAVMGVNTTAFLESAALDKPCITIHSEQFLETQQLPHFHHLTDAGFLETAVGVQGLVEIASNIRNGLDVRLQERHAFVKNFLSPCNKTAPQTYADVLEEIAVKKAGAKFTA